MNFAPLKYDDLKFVPKDYRPSMCEDTKGLVATDDDGVAQAICVLDHWSYNSAMAHIWIGNPIVLRQGMKELFNWVFEECGRKMIIGILSSNNERALKFVKHMGFEEQLRIKDGQADGIDHVLTILHKENCRYL